MTRTAFALSLVLALVVAGCSGESEDATDIPRPSFANTTTTSTTIPSTTTSTTVPISIESAPAGLVDLVEGFYGYATGDSTKSPPAPKKVLSAITPGSPDHPTRGGATSGVFKGKTTAVVEMGEDLFLAVENKNGWRIVGGKWPSLGVPAYFGEGPRHVAVVGSDARPGQDVDRSRADSIHFVALDGEGGGAVVGLPRDSYVPVPGFGSRKITTSLSLGGPETMMSAFDELTGLPLEGYVLTGFSGFESLLGSVLGGVDVEVPFSINDRWAHVSLQAGKQVLNGAEALGFARARKTVPGGDFTRSEHQGIILLSATEMVKSMGMASIPGLLEASEPHLETDLSPAQLLTFSAMAISADLDEVVNVVAPGSPGWAGSASVVYLSSSAEDMWDDLADGTLDP